MILRADAFALPFLDGAFDVIVADPPYEISNPASKHLLSPSRKGSGDGRKRLSELGYIEYRGREWWHEAWRVLSRDGHLYVFAVLKELPGWYAVAGVPEDIIAWVAPNAQGVQSKIRRVIGGRSKAWRPILHWRKGRPNTWMRATEEHRGELIQANYFIESQVQSNMAEALPWPNQLPTRLVAWLLRPHRGAKVLDLFSGTGTTREAAIGLGLPVVSVDLSPEALSITSQRPAQLGLL